MRENWFNWGNFCQQMLNIRDASEHASVFEPVVCPRSLLGEAEGLIRFLEIEDNVEIVIAENQRGHAALPAAHHIT